MNGMRSPAVDTNAVERAHLKKVVEAGGLDGLTRQMAQSRLTAMEIAELIQKARSQPIAQPSWPGAEAPRRGAKSDRYPIYFTAEDIKMGRGERSHD